MHDGPRPILPVGWGGGGGGAFQFTGCMCILRNETIPLWSFDPVR